MFLIHKQTIIILILIILLAVGLYFFNLNNKDVNLGVNNNEFCDLGKNSLEECDGQIVRMTESDTDKYDEIKMMQAPIAMIIPGAVYETFFTSDYGYFRLIAKENIDNCDNKMTVIGRLGLRECSSDLAKVCDPHPRIWVEKIECN